MANEKRPLGRDKNVTGGGHGVHRRGEGLGSGPVGSGSNPFGRAGSNPVSSGGGSTGGSNRGGNRGRGRRRGGGGLIAVLLLLLLGGGGGALNGLLGGSEESYSEPSYSYSDSYQSSSGSQSSSAGDIFGSAMDLFNTDGLYSYSGSGSSSGSSSGSYSTMPSLSDLLESMTDSPYSSYSSPSVSSGWSANANTGILNGKVAPEARERYTVLRGNGKDTVTLLVYMCGADLESRSAMATRDLLEMTKADISDKVNVIVYTGGAKQWQNNIISSSVNQIYRVKNGGLSVLEKNAGVGAMTDPNTLASFIQYGAKNFPADRYALVLWDHGGGSLSGYGYDEKNARSGSMSLASLDKALAAGDLYYDFIGFDTCLMATVENAIMLTKYADYMIASEETEPGTGWYYTDWLTSLSRNTSIATTTLGKQIIDDYINFCASSSRGQAATLSLVDLAELEGTLPKDFAAFSSDLRESISTGDFMTVSSARSSSREFAASTRIDQVDFVDFAQRIGSESSKELVKVLLSAVKYNRTSASMTNAYGLSVYFPLRKMSSVDTALQTYSALGLDSNFSGAIREFASMELSGQASSHGSYGTDPLESLFGNMYSGSSSSYSSSYSSDDITGLISGLLGSGDLSELLGGGSASFFTGRSTADISKDAAYIANNRFDATALLWTENSDGLPSLSLSDKQWSLVRQVDVNLFYDDGEGFVDLGLDNSFTFDKNGALVPDVSGTWVSINEWPVAYYHDSTVVDGSHYTISGHVPAYLTGTRSFDDGSTVRFDKQRVDLELLFTDEQPHGYVAGARIVYDDSETDTVARGLIELADGDVLDFICDYYSYDGSYQDSYLLGDALTVDGELQISDTYLGEGGTMIVCRFTDIYGQDYWTQAITLG